MKGYVDKEMRDAVVYGVLGILRKRGLTRL
jgi:hypothetical protein